MEPATLAVHAGLEPGGGMATPIHQSATFDLDAKAMEALAAGRKRDALLYSRYGNPSQWAVQRKLAMLEGGESCVVFSSGMAAISTSVLALLEPGAHLVASRDLYGTTYGLFRDELPAFGHEVSFVDLSEPRRLEDALRPETGAVYCEALSNPLVRVADLEALAEIAHRHGALLLTDATFATPLGTRPLERGADLVLHSCSKYLNGHSDLIAGCAVGSQARLDRVWERLLRFGGALDPHACFLLERGLKTLGVRMAAHEANAWRIARWLDAQPAVRRVDYPRLPSHPDHALAERVLRNAGGVVSFVIDGDDAAATRLCESLELIRLATSLGGVESLISQPFNTSHASYSAEARAELGILPGTIRLSVGIEDPVDLEADLARAFRRALS